jgi:hypothetical protein
MTDSDQRVYSPDDVDKARARGEAKLHAMGLNDAQIKHLRAKAKHDLFFLAYGVLGYDKLSKGLHLQLCKWLQSFDTEQFRLILLPRSHYKSTITTISDSIRVILPDDLGTSPYPRSLGLNGRVLIAHETDQSAQRFLSSIRDFIFQSEVLLALFPEITPTRGRTDNKTELELNRDRIWSEGTFNTMGVGGRKQGAHFNYIKADDLQGEDATYSKADMEKLLRWTDNLQSYLVTPKDDHIDFIGTRWRFDDVYAHIMRTYDTNLKIYHRAVEEYDPVSKKKLPIFPEEFTTASLDILRKNKKIFNAQYLNNPSEGAATFQPEWKRYFTWSGRSVCVKSGDSEIFYNTQDMDKIILVDPAVSGNFGYCVTGMTTRGEVFVLESHKREWSQPEFVNFLFSQVMKWNPRLVVIEDQLFMALYAHWLSREMSVRRTKFRIEPGKTRNKQKEARILGLSNYFAAGQIFFHQEQYDIIEEFDQFGASDNIHILDALAYGPGFWRKPPNASQIASNEQAEKFLMDRDSLTGYSSY